MTLKQTIIWINGAFGSGKTTIANELVSKFECGCMYDPEELGQFISAHVSDGMLYEDFQEHPLWTKLNAETLLHMGQSFEGVVIVPMTLIDEKRVSQIVTTLQAGGVNVLMFTLKASKETLEQRLLKRGDVAGSWPHTKIEACINALNENKMSHQIETDEKTVSAISSEIYNEIIDLIK